MKFSYEIEPANGYSIIHLKGQITQRLETEELVDDVESLINHGSNLFILDCKELDYVNSSGLSILVRILTKARKSGGEALLCELTKKVKELFIITKLNNVFTVMNTMTDATRMMKAYK